MDNIVIFIFPLVTNISFYNINPGSKPGSITGRRIVNGKKSIRKTKSLEVFPKTIESSEIKKGSSASCFNLSLLYKETRSEIINPYIHPKFSLHQSNVLYCFFFMAAFIILFLDIYLQISRGFGTTFKRWLMDHDAGIITKTFSFILLLNLLLWLDFNRECRKCSCESYKKSFPIKQIFRFPLYPFIFLYSKIK